MKTIYKTAGLIIGIMAGTATFAQRKNDPTYSIHNYKHPNKSAEMKRIEDERPKVYLEEVGADSIRPDNTISAGPTNYKAINPETFKIKKFRTKEAPVINPLIVPRSGNYKQQAPPTERLERKNPVKTNKRPEPVV